MEQAQVALDQANLDLKRTEIRAPVNGYITNLDVRVGDYASAGSPRLALIDSHSYYVYGYFEETKLPQRRVSDPVDIRLMAGNVRLKGRISGITHGITDSDNPTGGDLLADVVQPSAGCGWLSGYRCASRSIPANCPPIR